MRKQVRRWIKIGAGLLLVALGLVGLVTPGLQGILFALLGLKLLTDESPLARRWVRKLKERLPERAQRWLRKVRLARRTNDPTG